MCVCVSVCVCVCVCVCVREREREREFSGATCDLVSSYSVLINWRSSQSMCVSAYPSSEEQNKQRRKRGRAIQTNKPVQGE